MHCTLINMHLFYLENYYMPKTLIFQFYIQNSIISQKISMSNHYKLMILVKLLE